MSQLMMFSTSNEDMPIFSHGAGTEEAPTLTYLMSRSGQQGSSELWFNKETKQYIIHAYIRKGELTYKYEITADEGDQYNIGDAISNEGRLPANAVEMGHTRTWRIDQ